MGKSWVMQAGYSIGLNGRDGKTGDHLQVLICEKESEERGKRELLDGGGKRTSSLLNVPPTKMHFEALLEVEDYG